MPNTPTPTPSNDLSSDLPFNNDNLNDYGGDKLLVKRSVNLNKNTYLRYVAYVVKGYFNDRVT